MRYPTYDKASLAELLAKADDLGAAQRAVVREHAIRLGMSKTGEGRVVVTEMLDAMESMDQEAVLDLTEGEPRTLSDALARYIRIMGDYEEEMGNLRTAAADLSAILEYPWHGEEATISLHDPHYGLALHIEEGENRDLEIRMGSNRWLVHTVNWEDAGSGGQRAAQEVAEAVYRATLARVIADRDHHVQLNAAQVADLIQWLGHPNGSLADRFDGRLSVDKSGDGVIVRTRPYSHQSIPRPTA